MYERGRRNETLFSLIEKNVRMPVKVFGDLRAQLAACHIAEQQADTVEAYMQQVMDYAERLTRAATRAYGLTRPHESEALPNGMGAGAIAAPRYLCIGVSGCHRPAKRRPRCRSPGGRFTAGAKRRVGGGSTRKNGQET